MEMIKKIIFAAALAALALVVSGCVCSPSTNASRPPESVTVTPKTITGEYASFVTNYKWINEKNKDEIKFNSDGTFYGTINKKDYSGRFNLKADKNKTGVVHSEVTLDNEKDYRNWTFTFKDSAHMTLTTDKKVSESFAAEWTIEKKETE